MSGTRTMATGNRMKINLFSSFTFYYWYENGCLYPDMGAVFIALDPCTTENGCLQV